MPLGFLEGLVGGFGEQAEKARERERARADQEWNVKKSFLDDYVAGRYGEPTPEGLQEAFQGIAELAQGPKAKKGRGIMGRARGDLEVALPSLLKRIMGGEAPLYDENRPEGPVNAQGRPDMAMQQAPEQQPQPGSPMGMDAGVEIPEAGPAQQKVATPRPPAATQAESSLADAATRGAMQMGQTGPLQSRPITAGAPRLQSRPLQGQASPSPMEKTGPAALFMSPRAIEERERGIADRAAAAGVERNVNAYQALPQDWPEGRKRAGLGWTQDAATANQGPFANDEPFTFYNPEDPSQRDTFMVWNDGTVRTPGGRPLPEGWVQQTKSSRTGMGPLDVFTDPATGQSTVVSLEGLFTGEGNPYRPVDPNVGLPASLPLGVGDRVITTDAPGAAAVEKARRILPVAQDELGDFNIFRETEEEYAARSQAIAQKYGYASMEAMAIAAAGQTEQRVPQQPGARRPRSLTPPPLEEAATPGYSPGPGAPGQAGPGEGDYSLFGWLGSQPPPDPLTIETESDDRIMGWYFGSTPMGQELKAAEPDPQRLYEKVRRDPSFLEAIRQRLLEMSEAIYAAAG